MADIKHLSKVVGLSVRTLRRIDKAGYLKVSASADLIAEAIGEKLRRHQPLTALQQLHLLKSPVAVKALDEWEPEIAAILAAQGDAIAEAAPWAISSQIDLVAKKKRDAIETVALWLRDHLTTSPALDDGQTCDHAYLAVRLLANVPDHSLALLARKINVCMFHCRKHEALQGFWKVSDKKTLYFRKSFDL